MYAGMQAHVCACDPTVLARALAFKNTLTHTRLYASPLGISHTRSDAGALRMWAGVSTCKRVTHVMQLAQKVTVFVCGEISDPAV